MPHEGFKSTVTFPFLNSSPAIMIIWTFLCLNWNEILSRVLSTGHKKEQVMVYDYEISVINAHMAEFIFHSLNYDLESNLRQRH